MKRIFSAIFLVIFFVAATVSIVRADQLDDVTRELEALKKELSGKEANYQKLSTQLNSIKSKLVILSSEIQKKEKEVKEGEQALTYQKNLLNERAKNYYKNISKSSISLINILVAEDFSKSLQNFFYQKSLVDEDKRTIIKVVLYIKDLEAKKASLEKEKIQMAALQKEVDSQATILNTEIAKTRTRVAQLNALQQSLIAQKLASLNISRSAGSMGRCDSDLTNGRDPGFSPRFGFFTYGVPNRVGLNQYGAYGRARAGQNEEDILRAYYNNFELKKDYNQDIMINVEGKGSFKIEDYVKHIYEIPEAWGADGMAALKAQAIAARSYALAYTNNGSGSICATENCQVFGDSEKGGRWNEAVESTKGWVMVQGGNPIKAWFSSTHGGYIFSSGEIGWSGTDWTKHANDFNGSVNSFSDLNSNAYDRDSPWFYCDWGSRSEFNKTAWLKPNEVADIVNVILLARYSDVDKNHLFQPDKSNPAGTDTWDAEKVKSELRSRGGNPINSVNDISVSADFGSGRSTNINVTGDTTSASISASEFKDWFNLRAPANVQIVGPLFNAEKR